MTIPKEEQKHTDLLPTAVIERLRKYADEGDAETDHWIDIHGDIHILLNYIEATRKADYPVTPEGKPIFGEGSAWDIKSYLAGVASVKADCHEELVPEIKAILAWWGEVERLKQIHHEAPNYSNGKAERHECYTKEKAWSNAYHSPIHEMMPRAIKVLESLGQNVLNIPELGQDKDNFARATNHQGEG